MIYAIIYDRPGVLRGNDAINAEIRNLTGDWASVRGRIWFINTEATAEAISGLLMPHLDNENDSLLILPVDDNYYGWLPNEVTEWFIRQQGHNA
jgi:hypothetical protein